MHRRVFWISLVSHAHFQVRILGNECTSRRSFTLRKKYIQLCGLCLQLCCTAQCVFGLYHLLLDVSPHVLGASSGTFLYTCWEPLRKLLLSATGMKRQTCHTTYGTAWKYIGRVKTVFCVWCLPADSVVSNSLCRKLKAPSLWNS